MLDRADIPGKFIGRETGESGKKKSLLIGEILKVFDQKLPATPGLTILEVGGASGEYLLYLARRFGYKAHSLDYSRVGNEQTLETFAMAGIPVEVFERDLFADNGGSVPWRAGIESKTNNNYFILFSTIFSKPIRVFRS